jgi:hypothetical protein
MHYPLDSCVAWRYSAPMNVASAVRPPLPRRGRNTKKRPGGNSTGGTPHNPASRGPRPMSPGFDAEFRGAPQPSACPGGTAGNSPTFQRWVGTPKASQVPKGRLSGSPVSAVPSGLVGLCTPKPNVERYRLLSCVPPGRTRNPGGIGRPRPFPARAGGSISHRLKLA